MGNREYLKKQQSIIRDEWKSADAGSKMIYWQHNLANNYLGANSNRDNGIKSDIIISELAKLIVNKPVVVLDIYFKNFNEKISNGRRAIVKAVAKGLNKSQKFAKDIAIEIAKQNRMTMRSADGADILNSASGIVSGRGSIFGGKQAVATAQATAEAAKANAEAELHKATAAIAASQNTKSNIGVYILVAIGIGGVVGVVLWAVRK